MASRVRPLVYGDLPAVLAIERRSFETPWSLAMFVLELSKPSGICLCTADGDGLSGYLVCSRYADVWHLMNIAVDPEHRRRGIATELIDRAVRRGRPRRTVHARGPDLERPRRSRCTSASGSGPPGHRRRYYHDNGEDALIMWLEPTSSRHSARPRLRACEVGPLDPRDRDVV